MLQENIQEKNLQNIEYNVHNIQSSAEKIKKLEKELENLKKQNEQLQDTLQKNQQYSRKFLPTITIVTSNSIQNHVLIINKIFKPPNVNYINISETLQISENEFLPYKYDIRNLVNSGLLVYQNLERMKKNEEFLKLFL
ncbi:12009_t:CDS:2, partial [Funneliformis geosporum]